MRFIWRDVAATVVVAALVVPFVGYMGIGSMPFIQDPTGMAALGLPLGVVGAAVGGWIIESNAMLRFTTTIVGAAAAVLGLIALVTENVLELATREELLIAFVASVVVLWLTAVGEHSGLHLGRRPTGAPRVHA